MDPKVSEVNYVGMLNQLMQKRKLNPPVYTDFVMTGPPNAPKMKIAVSLTVDGFEIKESEEKSGVNKKELKQLLAMKVLDMIGSGEVKGNQLANVAIANAATPTPNAIAAAAVVTSPLVYNYKTNGFPNVQVPGPSLTPPASALGVGIQADMTPLALDEFNEEQDYVSELQFLCAKSSRFPLPIYTVLGQSGCDHKPTFRMECKVGEFRVDETRMEKKKKINRRLAQKMLHLLNQVGNNVVNSTDAGRTDLQKFLDKEGISTSAPRTAASQYETLGIDVVPSTKKAIVHIFWNNMKYSFHGDGVNVAESVAIAFNNVEKMIEDAAAAGDKHCDN